MRQDRPDERLKSPTYDRVGGAIEENLFAWWDVFENLPTVEVYRGPDMVSVVSGVKHPLCNHVLRSRLDESDADERIEAVLAPLRERRIPFFRWVSPTTTPLNLGERLVRHGLVMAEDASCMAPPLAGIDFQDRSPASYSIERVGAPRPSMVGSAPSARVSRYPASSVISTGIACWRRVSRRTPPCVTTWESTTAGPSRPARYCFQPGSPDSTTGPPSPRRAAGEWDRR